MKIRNTIALLAIVLLGATNTQAKSNLIPTTGKICQFVKQGPPEKNPTMGSSSDDSGGGIIYDYNPPLHEPSTKDPGK